MLNTARLFPLLICFVLILLLPIRSALAQELNEEFFNHCIRMFFLFTLVGAILYHFKLEKQKEQKKVDNAKRLTQSQPPATPPPIKTISLFEKYKKQIDEFVNQRLRNGCYDPECNKCDTVDVSDNELDEIADGDESSLTWYMLKPRLVSDSPHSLDDDYDSDIFKQHEYEDVESAVEDCLSLVKSLHRLHKAEEAEQIGDNRTFVSDSLKTELKAYLYKCKQAAAKELEEAFKEIITTRRALRKIVDLEKFRSTGGNSIEPRRTIYLSDIDSTLVPSKPTLLNIEEQLVHGMPGNETRIPEIHVSYHSNIVERVNDDIRAYNNLVDRDMQLSKDNKLYFRDLRARYDQGHDTATLVRMRHMIGWIELAESFPCSYRVDFDGKEGIAVIDYRLPDVVYSPVLKLVEQKRGPVEKPITVKEKKEKLPLLHPAIILRIAYEVFRADCRDAIKLLVVNGWVEFDDPATGKRSSVFVASLMVDKKQIMSLQLDRLNPLVAFQSLKGKIAGTVVEVIPITPVLSINRDDSRIVPTKEVLDTLNSATNLAAMDWKEFENLIAELFQKEWAREGAEVHVTQSSRDRGVDAIVFDPDPIKGGKFVIQAKRYTKTVDVSAVRDLCAVVKKEGASRGILVTTSDFGADAYKFANNEPVTLLNGGELLGLLDKHGYKFRIDISEARKFLKGTDN